MARSVIDPVTRIEGHLRVEMEVENGVVSDAWVSGGCFRGMELVVKDRTPEDAAQIVQRICGVCPVSHSHAATIAAEKAYGITISNNARIIRNLIEGAQFLHSHILWFYTLAALDYVNPLERPEGQRRQRLRPGSGCWHFLPVRPRRHCRSASPSSPRMVSCPSSPVTGGRTASPIPSYKLSCRARPDLLPLTTSRL